MITVSLVSSVRKRLPSPAWAPTLLLAILPLVAACSMGEAEVYNARLSPFPQIGGTPAGVGSATATLNGTTLEVSGTFEGLTHRAGRGGGDPMPVLAMGAGLRSGEMTGVAGAQLFDLTVEPAGEDGASGTISGSVELTAEQVGLLRDGRIYAQIDSEGAPDGHLWGWFLQ